MLRAGANSNLDIACDAPISEEDRQVAPHCGPRGLEAGMVVLLHIFARLEEYGHLKVLAVALGLLGDAGVRGVGGVFVELIPATPNDYCELFASLGGGLPPAPFGLD